MIRDLVRYSERKVVWPLRFLLILGLLAASQFAFPHNALADTTSASDNFARADGPLGPNWTDVSDGGLAISSGAVIGTAGQVTGDMWTANTFTSDQFSQVQVTSTQLSGGLWIGPAVRMQAGGQGAYVGIYNWNNGSPELMLFKRVSGNWGQVGAAYSSGPLAAGTQLELTAVGNTIAFLENGVQRIAVSDSTLTGGAPGIMAFGNATAGNWSGGDVLSYTIGGTVSGLSGTVLLQDNGGDTLSVGSNGSFTFATPVASGAGYGVTVKSYPSGQICTVSGGSGTVGSANVTNVAVSCAASPTQGATSASDDFARAGGPLGPNWTDVSDGGLAISSGAVIGQAGLLAGDMWTENSFASDQFSQVQVTPTQLSGGLWIGPAVRMQAGGQSAYAGIYNWNNGAPELQLFLRNAGGFALLGSYNSGPLPAGTRLRLIAIGNTIALLEDGVLRIGVSDSTLTGGAPGIMAFGNAVAGHWSGGNAADFRVSYQSTDSSGIKSYSIISDDNGYGPQTLRVLTPTNPASNVAHNFLIVLPVEAGLGSNFGDGLATLQALDAQDKYNLTIIEPTFAIDPWYANDPNDPQLQYETFMTQELVPWIEQNLATTGNEQVWLMGFSKSGIGGQDLILKHPGLFSLAATWDFPADMSSYNQFGTDSAANYGTDANFQASYRLTAAFVHAHRAPFRTANRIWIGGYGLYQTDDSDYDALLTAQGIAHSTETPQYMAHRWDSGWVPLALAALYQDSLNIPRT